MTLTERFQEFLEIRRNPISCFPNVCTEIPINNFQKSQLGPVGSLNNQVTRIVVTTLFV